MSGLLVWAIAFAIGANFCETNERSTSISGNFDGSTYWIEAFSIFANASTSTSEKLKQLFEDSQVTTLQYIKIKIIHK